MIEPIDSLAVSMHHNPGVYALLLGSGVSRSARIPTGYEVTLNLIREIAASVGEACTPDPESWFRTKYGEDADYSKILANVATAQPERKAIIQPYFELSPEEREEAIDGYKVPTEAHHRIANLVANGYIRVIATTNFDSLMEQALDAISVSYQVIDSSDSIGGALPLAHSKCTIFKINGDYKDARIKNTVEELSSYEEPVNRLIKQVIEEYGLIVCGWSADYDIALREAIVTSTPKFASYWVVRGNPRDQAKPLIEHTKGTIIVSPSADEFFQQLEEKVIALSNLENIEVPTAKMAVATLKRYLPEAKYEIRLHDFVVEQTEALYNAVDNIPNTQYSHDELRKKVTEYETQCEVMLSIMSTGCYWSKTEQDRIWVSALQRIANASQNFNGYSDLWIKLRGYPALLLLYAGGIAALAAGNYHMLKAILHNPKVKNDFGVDQPIVVATTSDNVLRKDRAQFLIDDDRNYFFPLTDRIFTALREPLRSLIPNDDRYENLFDTFQYIVALVHADLYEKTNQEQFYGPLGRFAWKRVNSYNNNSVVEKFQAESSTLGDESPYVKVGLIESATRLQQLQAKINESVLGQGWRG